MSNKKSREASESRYISAIKLMNKPRQKKENNRIKKKLSGDDYDKNGRDNM